MTHRWTLARVVVWIILVGAGVMQVLFPVVRVATGQPVTWPTTLGAPYSPVVAQDFGGGVQTLCSADVLWSVSSATGADRWLSLIPDVMCFAVVVWVGVLTLRTIRLLEEEQPDVARAAALLRRCAIILLVWALAGTLAASALDSLVAHRSTLTAPDVFSFGRSRYGTDFLVTAIAYVIGEGLVRRSAGLPLPDPPRTD